MVKRYKRSSRSRALKHTWYCTAYCLPRVAQARIHRFCDFTLPRAHRREQQAFHNRPPVRRENIENVEFLVWVDWCTLTIFLKVCNYIFTSSKGVDASNFIFLDFFFCIERWREEGLRLPKFFLEVTQPLSGPACSSELSGRGTLLEPRVLHLHVCTCSYGCSYYFCRKETYGVVQCIVNNRVRHNL